MRDLTLKSILPTITTTEPAEGMEAFQNSVLRPILKFQNELLLQFLAEELKKLKNRFYNLNDVEKSQFVDNLLKSNQELKQVLLGMIIGFLGQEDLKFYFENEKEVKKRIFSMLIKRFQTQVDALK